jgi:two-component system LytT family response regulator
MISCIAIDDEPLALELLKTYIQKMSSLYFMGAYEDALNAVEFLKNNKVDLLFLDINMPDINGLDLFKSLKEKPMVIFTTAYSSHAVEGFELQAIDYLLKPFTFERFSKAINKVMDYQQFKNQNLNSDSAYLFVKSGYDLVKITWEDITYIEGLDDYIKIHLATGKTVVTLMTLKTVLERLPQEKFVRIHRSFIVPTGKIQGMRKRKLLLNDIELPIGETYYPQVTAAFEAKRLKE